MKIYSEKSLQEFKFWSGADDNAFEFEWVCAVIGLTYDAQNDEIIRE